MSTHNLFRQGPRRVYAAGAGALVVAATLFLGLQGAPDESAWAANRDVEMHMARIPVQDLDELNKTSDAVVLGRVVATGAVHFILPSGEKPHAFQPSATPKDLPKDKAGAGKTPEISRFQPNIITPPAGMPVTDFTIEVSQVMRDGSGVSKGSRITVSQPGGVVQIPLGQGAPTLTRTMLAEHDALMVPGQEQVLFLQKAGTGFVVTGGPDGRFKLDAKRTLQPIDEGSPVGQAHKGQTIDGLQSELHNKGIAQQVDG